MTDYTDESCSTASGERDEELQLPAHKEINREPHYKNLFSNQSSIRPDHGIVICGHRGGMGKSEPENTMRAFKKAKLLGLQMIEFDVSVKNLYLDPNFATYLQIWLTADDQLVIIHGGDNGEMPAPLDLDQNTCNQLNQEYIFEQTYSDLQSKFVKTKYFVNSPQDDDSLVPTVEQLLEFLKGSPMCMNIEIKVPYDKDIKSKYRWRTCVQKLYELILKHSMQEFSIVQSFDKECMDSLKDIDASGVLKPLYLQNFFYDTPRPSIEEMTKVMGIGSHL